MTQKEWNSCEEPGLLLAEVTSADVVRRIVCACCRRLLAEFPADYAVKRFEWEDCEPGGYVSPHDWPHALLEKVVLALETPDADPGTLALLHNEARIAEKQLDQGYSWANAKLGDSATGAECAVGYVGSYMAAAAASACSDGDLTKVATHCLYCLSRAFGQRGDHVPAEEQRKQCEIIRLNWKKEL